MHRQIVDNCKWIERHQRKNKRHSNLFEANRYQWMHNMGAIGIKWWTNVCEAAKKSPKARVSNM